MNRLRDDNASLRIAINAQKRKGSTDGGVVSVLLGLISALGKLNDGEEEYTIIGPYYDTNWLKPFIGPNMQLVQGQAPSKKSNEAKYIKKIKNKLRNKFKSIAINYLNLPRVGPQLNLSNGFFEQLGCDVLHFPYQNFQLCSMPSVYNLHDLQHLHFPQYFTPDKIESRETIFQTACHYSQKVIVASNWVKNDVISQYSLDPNKIQVIPWAPPTDVFSSPSKDQINKLREKYNLPHEFVFYPAMLWPHKNHMMLIKSLAYLRDNKDIHINLVCTGGRDAAYKSVIDDLVQKLGLIDQVYILGFIPHEELRSLYKLSTFVVVPTLFEAASGPVFEAWHNEVPVACSNVTSLPDQGGDAVLLFNPYSVESISNAILELFINGDLREKLVQKGIKRLSDFSWERTAKAYRAVYRQVGNKPLTEEDHFILGWDWMQNPQK